MSLEAVYVLVRAVRYHGCQLLLLPHRVQHVAVHSHHQRGLAQCGQRGRVPSPAPSHVVTIECLREADVRVGVEASEQLGSLVQQVALHLEGGRLLCGVCGCGRGGDGAVELGLVHGLRAVGDHGELSREGQSCGGRLFGRIAAVAVQRVGVDRLPLRVVDRDLPRAVLGVARQRHQRLHALRVEQRPLQRLHAAQAAAHHSAHSLHAQPFEQQPVVRVHAVAHCRDGEVRSPLPSRLRVDLRGAGRAVAAAEQVGADDEVAAGVEGEAVSQ